MVKVFESIVFFKSWSKIYCNILMYKINHFPSF
nr:MAG TPA: hypothetical protein [Caudoviricetes sp.]